jgi:hypothetical protein
MLRKLVMAVPIVSAFALCAPGSSPPVQSAPLSPALDPASTSLVQLVGRRGGGGPVFRGGGGGGGRSWGGGGGGGRSWSGGGGGGGRSWSGGGGGGGGFSRPSFRSSGGGDRFVGRPSFRRFGGDGSGSRWRAGDIGRREYNRGWSGPRFSGGEGRRRDYDRGSFRRGHFAHWKKHRRHRRFYPWYYSGLGFYSSGLYGYDDCAYLRDRAVATGSLYWWRRYQNCQYGYEY